MSEWKTIPADVFCDTVRDGTHDTPKQVDKGYKLVTAKHINNGQIDLSDAYLISEKDYLKINERSKVEQWDVLMSMIGNGLGKSAVVKYNPDYAIKNLALFKLGNEIKAKWLHYYLSSKAGQGFIYNSLQGAGQPFISLSLLRKFPIPVPNDETIMGNVVAVLSRYDSLIENYQKQIKLLEEAAQRLYKEWFVDLHFPGHETTKIVDGVPKGWEKKPISQLGEYLNGFAFKPSDWQKSGKPIIKIKEMGNGVSNDTPRNNGERVPAKYLVKAGDLLFSWSATLMVIVWSGEEGWLNQHLFKVTPSKGIEREFLLQSISNTIEEFQNLTTGSTMKHIQRNKLDQVFVNVPNDEIMKRYSSIAEKERTEILHLSSQIRLLTEARDRLLPKLMSGEIEI